MELRGRAGIVLGAESPIGSAVARALAEAGARVLPAPADAVPALAEGIGAEGAGRSAETAGPESEPLDFLVEATVLPPCPSSLAETAGLEAALVGTARPFAAAVQLVPRLARGGALVVVSAPLGPTPEEGWLGPLLAWRAAAVTALARDLAPKGVRVNGLAPVLDGAARLPAFLKRGAPQPPTTPLGRAAEPGEVAEAALWLLRAGMVTGLTLPLDGGRGL